jgi:hypothetical protein
MAALIAMAVKTELLHSTTLLRLIERREAVAGHAGLILLCQRRQRFMLLVADAALFTNRDGCVDVGLSESRLVVRLVTVSAVFVARGIVYPFGAVSPLIQLVEDFIVAGYALTPVESVVRLFVEIRWIGMKRRLGHVIVTVQTGVLAMGGTVVLVGIQKPGIACPHRADTKKGNAYHEAKQ